MITTANPTSIATERFVSRCLRRTTSLFAPRDRLWTTDTLADLAARLGRAANRADDPTRSDGSPFTIRWQRMLARAGDDTVRLAAEVLYVHLLFPREVSGERKRTLVADTLARLDAPPAVPRELDAALDHGVVPAGVAYTRRRLSQLAWLAAAGAHWHELPAAKRRAGLDDPWQFAEALADVPAAGGGPQRSALCHLVHPATFAPVTSAAAKRTIIAAFREHLPDDEPDPDRALATIRAALVPTHGPDVSFFDPQIARIWQ